MFPRLNWDSRMSGKIISERIKILCLFCSCASVLIYFISSWAVSVYSLGPAEPNEPEIRTECHNSYERTATIGINQDDPSLPMLYIITPTYPRPEMIAQLTRLGQTLLLVARVHWIVAEDALSCSSSVTDTLTRLGLPFTHLASPMPLHYKPKKFKPLGVSNRRAALEWIKKHANSDGVMYFFDDDNTIDVRLLEQIRNTKKVSMFPVGLASSYSISAPILGDDGTVVDFLDSWDSGRKFKVDMAGFAVHVRFLKEQPDVTMPYLHGYEEDGFLQSLNIELTDIEPLANMCTEVLVWHTRTKSVTAPLASDLMEHSKAKNIELLLQKMKNMAMAA